MNKKILIGICVCLIAMALVGYTIGNLTYEPKIEYARPQNLWIREFEGQSELGISLWLEKITILNGEYESQNATIEYSFSYHSSFFTKTRFWVGISLYNRTKSKYGYLGEIVEWQIINHTFLAMPHEVTHQAYYSPKYNFTTPSTIGTYLIQIRVFFF